MHWYSELCTTKMALRKLLDAKYLLTVSSRARTADRERARGQRHGEAVPLRGRAAAPAHGAPHVPPLDLQRAGSADEVHALSGAG